MERLQAEHGVTVQWRAFELRPRGAPPIPPAYRAQIEARRPQLYAMAREQYGLEINAGPFGIDSRPALIGAKFAEAQGAGAAYNRHVLHAYWQAGLSIADRAVLGEVAGAASLDESAFFAALEDPTYIQLVDEDIMIAAALNIHGVPALLFNRKYLVSGAQPYPLLEQLVQQLSLTP